MKRHTINLPAALRNPDPEAEYTSATGRVTVYTGAGTERLARPGESRTGGRKVERSNDLDLARRRTARTLQARAKARAESLAGGINEVINASGHSVKTPGGPIAYHRDKQKAWLEEAQQHPVGSSIRKMAVTQAKEHGSAKRSLLRGGGSTSQPRVPAGNPKGGQWAKK